MGRQRRWGEAAAVGGGSGGGGGLMHWEKAAAVGAGSSSGGKPQSRMEMYSYSRSPRTSPTVAPFLQIGLCDPVKADL